jgi:membrane protein
VAASSLTFTTTVIALVPLITVALAVFTAFSDVLHPAGRDAEMADREPDPRGNISRQVLGYLTQFSARQASLGRSAWPCC